MVLIDPMAVILCEAGALGSEVANSELNAAPTGAAANQGLSRCYGWAGASLSRTTSCRSSAGDGDARGQHGTVWKLRAAGEAWAPPAQRAMVFSGYHGVSMLSD
jgi:hypothetical protein